MLSGAAPGAPAARHPGDFLTLAFAALLGAAAVTLTCLPFSVSLQAAFASGHQLTPRSMPTWAVVQVLPKMYGFAHQAWISDEPLSIEELAGERALPPRVRHLWFNHAPARITHWESSRALFALATRPLHVVISSSYRGRTWWSAVRVDHDGRGLRIVPESRAFPATPSRARVDRVAPARETASVERPGASSAACVSQGTPRGWPERLAHRATASAG